MLISYKLGQGSVLLRVKIPDSSKSDNSGVTGLTSSTTGLNISVVADNEASSTIYTGSNIESITTLGTYAAPTSSKCRFKEFDATNHPGVYELQIADARYAVSNAKSLLITILAISASDAAQVDILIPLTVFDPYAINDVRLADGVAHGGTTASLALKSLDIINSSGNAISVESTNGGYGAWIKGVYGGMALQGTAQYADGLDIMAGDDANGIFINSVRLSGIHISTVDAANIQLETSGTTGASCITAFPAGTNVHGLEIRGGTVSGNAINLTVTDPATDFGIASNGNIQNVILADGVAHGGTPGSSTATYSGERFVLQNAASAATLSVTNTVGNALNLVAEGTSLEISTTGGANAVVISANDPDTCGINISGGFAGIYVYASAATSAPYAGALVLEAAGGPAVSILADDDGDGISIRAVGTDRHGINITGGTVSGNAINLTVTDPATDFGIATNGNIQNVILADGVAHGGTPGLGTATLALQQINVTNYSSSGAVIFTGDGSQAGLKLIGGPSGGEGFYSIGGGSGGDGGIFKGHESSGGTGLRIIGGNGGNGLNIELPTDTPLNGSSALAIYNPNDVAISINSVVSHGINIGAGTEADSHGINIAGGSTSGNAINCTTTDGHGINLMINGDAIHAESTGNNGHGIYCEGNGSGSGFLVKGGDTGHGMQLMSGTTSGDGFHVSGLDNGVVFLGGDNGGSGMIIRGGEGGDGLDISTFGSGTANDGSAAIGIFNPHDVAINIQSTLSHGINIIAGSDASSHSINLTSASGYGINGTLSPTLLSSFFLTDSGQEYSDAIAGSVVKEVVDNVSGASPSAIATAVWQDAISGDFTVSGSIGKSLFTGGVVPGGTNGLFIAGTNAATTVTSSFTTNIIGNLTGSIGDITATALSKFFLTNSTTTFASAVSGSVVKEIVDNAGGSSGPTAVDIATAVWQDAISGDFTVSGSIGKSLFTGGVVPGGTNGLFIAGTNAATTITTSLTTHFVGTVDTVTTVTNQLSASAIATGVWQSTTSGNFTVSGSIGKSLFTSGNAPGTSGGLALYNGIVVVNSYSSGQDPATLVLGATASSWNTVLTIGHAINAAGTAADPWTTILPGSYGVGTAGYIIGNFAVSTVSIGNPVAF